MRKKSREKKTFAEVNKVQSDEKEKSFELQMKEREMVVNNKKNKVTKEDKKHSERKAYLVDKEKNIDKREGMLHKKEKELVEMKKISSQF